MCTSLEILLDNFTNITSKPENFISPQPNFCNEIKSFLKGAYDFIKNEEENSTKSNALPELIIDNFDIEQIWQQLELQNEELLNKSIAPVSKFVVSKDHLFFEELEMDLSPDILHDNDKNEYIESGNKSNSDSEMENEDLGDLIDSQSSDAELDDKEEDNNTEHENDMKIKNKSEKRSIVDDEFFKLDEMEEFLKTEEKALNKEANDDLDNDSESKDEEIDMFENGSDLDDDDEKILREKNPKYKDFFRPNENSKSTKKSKLLGEDFSDNEDENKDPKSTFELRQERLKNKIKNIEDIALSDKPWQLQGEVTAESRPQNSLLEEIVEFDLTSRPAPVITEETTFQLEDIIRQRIKDCAFDSVERKERLIETPLEYKKKLVLDQEKSKESLAQIYEKEYLQQKEALSGNVEEEEEPELHKEIKKMIQNLFKQLDALSNFHFTPKPAAPELKIISNLPAISMEEVAPVAATNASLLAPEEIKRRIKGDIIGKSERTDADKNRERRKKKIKQRIHAKEKQKKDLVNKINPGLGNKYSKEKAKKQLKKIIKDKNVDKMDDTVGSKSVKSSTEFFKQLEEEVKSHVKVKSQMKRQKVDNGVSAKQTKL